MNNKRMLNLYAIYKLNQINLFKILSIYVTSPATVFMLFVFLRYLPIKYFYALFALIVLRAVIHHTSVKIVEENFDKAKKFELFFSIYDPFLIFFLLYSTNGLNSVFLVLALYNLLAAAFFYESENAIISYAVYHILFIILGLIQLHHNLPSFEYTLNFFSVSSTKEFIFWYFIAAYAGIIIYVLGDFFKKSIKEQLQSIENYLYLTSDIFLITRKHDYEIKYIRGKNPGRYNSDFTEFIGKKFTDFIYKDDIPKIVKRKEIGDKTGFFEPMVIRVVMPKGIFVFKVFTAPYFNKYNVTIVFDITEEMRKDRRLELQKKILYSAYFANAIIHELNNIMTVYEIEIPQIKEEKRRKRLITAFRRQKQLIQTFSMYIKKSPEIKEKVNICEVIRDAVNFVQILPTETPITYHIIGTDHDIYVLANYEHIKIAFNNLLANAVKAISTKGGPGVIEILVEECSESVISIKFKDNGIGISQEDLPHLFDISYNVKKKKGIGIGLFITKSIIEAYDGEVFVQSILGEGTTFEIKLPKY